jgi:hypothetical protein
LFQVSRNGEWIDNGKFLFLLGLFTTIKKAKQGLPLDKTKYLYLDAVHMDIVFRDCFSVSSFKYAIILVDCAIQYNWTFGLRSLSSGYGGRVGGPKYYAVNLILRLFLYHFLHMMSS